MVTWSPVLVVVFVAAAVDSSADALTLEVEPTETLVEAGKSLVVNCTVRGPVTPENHLYHQDETGQPISQRIQFYLGEVRLGVNSSKSEVEVLDDVSARLTVHNVSREMSGGHVTCHVTGESRVVSSVVNSSVVNVRVAEKPCEVDIDCVVYNWQRMNCTWPPLDTGVAVVYELHFGYSGLWYYACPFPSDTGCYWSDIDGDARYRFKPPSALFGDYYIFVAAKNELGSSSTYRTFRTSDIVKPDPVSGLQVVEGSIAVNSATVTWKSPNDAYTMLFRVSLKSSADSSVRVLNKTSAELMRVHLTDLAPFTDYKFSVDCIPLVDGNVLGFWSEAVSEQFATKEDVPAAAPEIGIGSFKSVSTGENMRQVEIYWQNIPERLRNGIIISSRVRYCAVGNCERNLSNFNARIAQSPEMCDHWMVQFPNSSVKLQLRSSCDYEIFVDAKTTAGFNASLALQRLFVPRHQRKPEAPSRLAMLYNRTAVMMAWSPVDEAVNYTLYWCHVSRAGQHCDGQMQWLSVSGNVTSAVIDRLQHDAVTSLQYAVSAEVMTSPPYRLVSSGMSQRRYCAFNISQRPMRPRDVRLTAHQEAESLTVEWSAPVCPYSGYISHYVVEYCRLDHDCDDVRTTTSVKFDAPATSYVIRQLTPGSTYRLRIKSSSFAAESAFTDFIQASVLPTEFAMASIIMAVVVVAVTAFLIFLVVCAVKNCRRVRQSWWNVTIVTPTVVRGEIQKHRQSFLLPNSTSSSSLSNSPDCPPDADIGSGSWATSCQYTADLGLLRSATPEMTSHAWQSSCDDAVTSYAAVKGVTATPDRNASNSGWKTSGGSSEQYVRGLVLVSGTSKDVDDCSTRPELATCDVPYVSQLIFNDHEDYDIEEDQDNDPEQSDDDVVSSSLVVESSPYLDAVIHINDVDLYSVVRPRATSCNSVA